MAKYEVDSSSQKRALPILLPLLTQLAWVLENCWPKKENERKATSHLPHTLACITRKWQTTVHLQQVVSHLLWWGWSVVCVCVCTREWVSVCVHVCMHACMCASMYIHFSIHIGFSPSAPELGSTMRLSRLPPPSMTTPLPGLPEAKTSCSWELNQEKGLFPPCAWFHVHTQTTTHSSFSATSTSHKSGGGNVYKNYWSARTPWRQRCVRACCLEATAQR